MENNQKNDAQEKAIAVKDNSVVSAGAGSGKTRVLSKRFTKLLVDNPSCSVDQILTLTFTKKATVEMNGRIYKELKEALPDKAKDFYKANIKTIDSYCGSVARLGCHLYGISPDFSVDDETISQKVCNMALPFILSHKDNPAIKQIVNTKAYAQIAEELFAKTVLYCATIVEPFDFDKTLRLQKKQIISEWKKLTDKASIQVNLLYSIFKSFAGNRKSQTFLSWKDSYPDGEIPATDEITENSFSDPDFYKELAYFNHMQKICAAGLGRLKNEDISKAMNSLKELLPSFAGIINYIYGYPLVKQLIPLIKEFEESVNKLKRKTGLLTYKDCSSLALKVLLEHPEIRKLEKDRYRYIMIDEFQDNNSDQRNLLFLLAEKPERMEKTFPEAKDLVKDKLFFVGDEKQSIYKFRGADVSVFRRLADDFKESNLPLSTNYRSNQALIASFNSIFGGMPYPPEEDDVQTHKSIFYTTGEVISLALKHSFVPEYEAVYQNVTMSKTAQDEITEKTKEKIFSPKVHIALNDTSAELDEPFITSDYAEAYWIAEKIKSIVKNNPDISYSDIAILFRTYSKQTIFERTFLNSGLPYNTETVKGFFTDGPTNDIMSFLRLVAYPDDTLSFATILHSPFANLSQTEINAAFGFINSTKENKPLFEYDIKPFISSKSYERFLKAKTVYEKLCALSVSENLTSMISYLWYDTGYRYETLWNTKVFMYNSLYDRLFELARKADLDSCGIAEFVDSLDSYQDETEKLDGMEIPLENSDGIHLLSIHKSKGLEYPVVFITGIGNQPKRDSNAEVCYFSEEFGLTFNTPACPLTGEKGNYFYNMQKTLNSQKTCAELRRLLYVAVTRAENEVYLTGSFSGVFDKKYNDSRTQVIPDRFLYLLQPFMMEFFKDGVFNSELQKSCPFTYEIIPPYEKNVFEKQKFSKEEAVEQIKDKVQDAEIIQKIIPVSPYIKPSQLHEPDEETASVTNKITIDRNIPYSEIDSIIESTRSVKNETPEFDFTNFGTIAHYYLECRIKNIKQEIPNKEITGLKGNEKAINQIDSICKKMSDDFIDSQVGKKVLSSLDKKLFVKSEFSFKSELEGKIVNGQIDLIFKDPDSDGYTIVDYKTNQKMQPEIYYNQLACYKDAIAKMLDVPSEKIKCFLFYLRYGKEVDITENCNSVNLNLVE